MLHNAPSLDLSSIILFWKKSRKIDHVLILNWYWIDMKLNIPLIKSCLKSEHLPCVGAGPSWTRSPKAHLGRRCGSTSTRCGCCRGRSRSAPAGQGACTAGGCGPCWPRGAGGRWNWSWKWSWSWRGGAGLAARLRTSRRSDGSCLLRRIGPRSSCCCWWCFGCGECGSGCPWQPWIADGYLTSEAIRELVFW